MSTSPSSPSQRYRLEIRRAQETFETHGYFATIVQAEQAAQDDIVGTGDHIRGVWMGPDSAHHWVATTNSATYRITRESKPVTTAPQYEGLSAPHPHCPLSDAQLRSAVRLGLEANSATAALRVDIDVMDHRVFLTGEVHDDSEIRLIEQVAANVSNVGEVVDLLDVTRA
jgi:hypothetical protein